LQPGRIVVFLSDDEGRTWRRSDTVLEKDESGTVINLMEPGVVETEPQRVMMLIRTKLGCLYASDSADGGEKWSAPRPTELLSPESPSTIAKIPESKDLLLIWNDHAGKPDEYRRATPPHRTPLSAATSRDGGKTWTTGRRLEDLPDHGYCYTAVAFTSGRVLLAYCAHRSAYGLETAQISSFRLKDILD
jgi:predicted neuraminidase